MVQIQPDSVIQWLNDLHKCYEAMGDNAEHQGETQDWLVKYVEWCEAHAAKPLHRNAFSSCLKDVGIPIRESKGYKDGKRRTFRNRIISRAILSKILFADQPKNDPPVASIRIETYDSEGKLLNLRVVKGGKITIDVKH